MIKKEWKEDKITIKSIKSLNHKKLGQKGLKGERKIEIIEIKIKAIDWSNKEINS